MKTLLVRGKYPYLYELYSDGSVEIVCTECDKKVSLDPEQAEKLTGRADWFKGYRCYDCWKANQALRKQVGNGEREDAITWGQAYNAAHEDALHISQQKDIEIGSDEYWELISRYQELHYNFIRKQKEAHQ